MWRADEDVGKLQADAYCGRAAVRDRGGWVLVAVHRVTEPNRLQLRPALESCKPNNSAHSIADKMAKYDEDPLRQMLKKVARALEAQGPHWWRTGAVVRWPTFQCNECITTHAKNNCSYMLTLRINKDFRV